MAEESTTEATQTDIFMQQKKVIDTLVNELARQGNIQAQPVYVSPPAEQKQDSPNYVLYAGLALAAILFFKK